MLCSFPLFAKPFYNMPIFHTIDHAGQQKKSRNFNSSSGSSSYYFNNRPKSIRTSISTNQKKFHKHDQYPKDFNFYDSSLAKEKPKHDEDGIKKAKSRGFKKPKQPISHGSRLSSFLNSLFTNGKKTKNSSNDNEDWKIKSANVSTRLSLSKNIISTPCEHNNYDMDQQNVEAINGINKNYVHEEYEDEDDIDEGASYASSDLFELDIFSSMGLPIYEATNLGTNYQAIDANGN
ncbi:protein BIG GRAIN 1-like A [Solanum pennellii]|uniref:Protein BIG GRAIN 1-like A n=1 Tax=Solanum pennellii TaxID=28526 RepID=A0ABM1FSA6_SOLPN|nr:protein BIG GRAIN 1-like A [Solanum pennellii]